MQVKEQSYPCWLEGVVVVSFDIDEGQKVSLSLPAPLTPERDKEISMLAFPDSNSCSENETLYKYTFCTAVGELAFVCFKQKKDPNNKRGYAQKSFVVLTRLPFLDFFQKVSELLVFKLFSVSQQQLQSQLERVIKQSKTWSEPQPLSKLILPVLDYQISTTTPNYLFANGQAFLKAENIAHSLRKVKPNSLEDIVAQESLLQLGRFQEVSLTQIFRGVEAQLWNLWEAAVLNRAVLIMADSPYLASQAVLGAVSLINPIQYAGELHPYVTVYNAQLPDLQAATGNVLLGGTNPLFAKLFAKGQVEVVRLGQSKPKKHLRPLRQLYVSSALEQQRLVNESALRKYFYKLNCGIIALLEQYLSLQTNDLKFFNEKQFLRFVRKYPKEDPLDQILDGKKACLVFWQEFVSTHNFLLLLRARHVVRERNV